MDFGSGTGHSAYIAAGFFPMDDGEMRWISDGIPEMRVAFLPRAEVTFTDGWHVQGLKGTGSPTTTTSPTHSCRPTGPSRCLPASRSGVAGREPNGSDAGHRGRSRAFALGVAESDLGPGEELTPRLRADMRVAAVYATGTARTAAEWAYLAAGTSAIREGTRLERAFRDIYTGTQHAFISEKVAVDDLASVRTAMTK